MTARIPKLTILLVLLSLAPVTAGHPTSIDAVRSTTQRTVFDDGHDSELRAITKQDRLSQEANDTLSYCPDSEGESVSYASEHVLMMYQMPADVILKGFNIPVYDWGQGEGQFLSIQIWKLTYPYGSDGLPYSTEFVDSTGWSGYWTDGMNDTLPFFYDLYYLPYPPYPDYFGDDSSEIGPCGGTDPVSNAQELLIDRPLWPSPSTISADLVPDHNPAQQDNWLRTIDWGSEPAISSGAWVGILARNFSESGSGPVSFYSCEGEGLVDPWVLAQFYTKCNGPSGEGGWHILSKVVNWEISVEYVDSLDIETGSPELPREIRLLPNYPNPFNASTMLRYELPVRSKVLLSIYDIKGNQVKTLVEAEQAAGPNSVAWDGTDDIGRPVASGVYLYRITVGHLIQTRKMVLIR